MNAVQQTIRILVVILLVHHARCQDGYSERDTLRYHQMANEAQNSAFPGYSGNVLQRNSNQQASSVNVQYQMTGEAENDEDYHRADRTRTRKVYRIKNPFQHQDDNRQDGTADPRDSSTGASNQYASMQYSLPPEEFLQQLKAENQYYQQSTPAPNLGYTATPQPQYQYSTITPANFDTNQQASQIPQIEPKSHTQYLTNTYQYSAPNTFSYDGVQSTVSPVTPFISTGLPNAQFVSTPSNSYVSSASSIYLSSPPNLQYVASPLSAIQTGSPDYSGNRVTTTIGNSQNYDNNDQTNKLQIDHYDNSANGIRYPVNVQRQYQSEYGSSTPSPNTPDPRDQWQNNLQVNAAPKSLHDVTYTQYQNYPYNQQENRADSNMDQTNSETHRIGNMPSANNIYLNYMQPDYQVTNNGRAKTRDLEQQTGQPEYYSNGEYGWKLGDKKPPTNDGYSSGNYQRYQTVGLSENGDAVSQMNFHMDTSKPQYNYGQVSKSTSDNIDAQEFARAAARAHENMKQQQSYYGNNYENSYNSNSNPSVTNSNPSVTNSNPYYTNYEKPKNKYYDSSSINNNYYNQQADLITASPYYYHSRDNNIDTKPKPSFDHAKALKNIVPIDVSNVVPNSESQQSKGPESNRYGIQNYERDLDRQQYRPLTDSYYKDKNAAYGLNIKTKPDEYPMPEQKLFDPHVQYYGKQQPQTQDNRDTTYNQGAFSGAPQRVSYLSQTPGNTPDSLQSSANIQQQGLQRPQSQMPTDINSILKLNDVPYQLTQNIPPETLKFHNINFDRGSIPSPLPIRINQDVGTHQLDVTSSLLSKLMLKQPGYNVNRPEIEAQGGSLVSTINGFKVANPYNVDLKLVADMLKGKSSIDETHNIMSFRDPYKPSPLKFDLSQLQLMLKNDNVGNLSPVSDGLSVLSSPFLEIYNSGRYPYQGVKYSRSQEEEEPLVPIADASSNHPIGAVMEQDDPSNEREDSTGPEASAIGESSIRINKEEERKKPYQSGHRSSAERHRHPNSIFAGRHSYQRKYPKTDIDEPYPLLKPPPPHSLRGRGSHVKLEKHSRRRRINKPKVFRIMKAEPLFEADSEDESYERPVPVVLRPPPVAESKSDVEVVNDDESS